MMMKLSSKKYFASLALFILFVDIVIILNISIFRSVLGFICFTILPGLLFLHILRLNNIQSLKNLLFSVGLSIFFLLFISLILNWALLYFNFLGPLSVIPIITSFSIILAIMIIFAYLRNRNYVYSVQIFTLNANEKGFLIIHMFFPWAIFILSILGTFLNNNYNYNMLIIINHFFIVIYLILIAFLNINASRHTFSVAIYIISLSVLFMWTLTSNYFLGMSTIYLEYESFQMVLQKQYWDLPLYPYPTILTACLSVSLLPTIYCAVLDINDIYIFKIIFPAIFSLFPVTCYVLFKKYMNDLNAFFSSFFIIAQVPYIYIMPQFIRGQITLLMFALIFLLHFDENIGIFEKKIIIIIFISTMVVSYYTIPLIYFALFFILFLFHKLKKNQTTSLSKEGNFLLLILILIFIWWSQITDTAFNWYVSVFQRTFINLGNFFIEEMKDQKVQAMLGEDITSLPLSITIIINELSFILITIGLFYVIIKKDSRFNDDFKLLSFCSFLLLASFMIIPYISTAYGAEKFFITVIIFLSPMFIVGTERVSRSIFHLRSSLALTVLMLICQFACATSLVYVIFDEPYSPVFDLKGPGHALYYVYDQEIVSVNWTLNYSAKGTKIYVDPQSLKKFIYVRSKYNYSNRLDINDKSIMNNKSFMKGIGFLGYSQVVNGEMYTGGFFNKPASMKDYIHLFVDKNKIYTVGGADVYIKE